MTGRSWLTAVVVALCLFFGFWAFVYEGYTEDAGSQPVRSWPYGAVLYGLAGLLILTIIRRERSDLSTGALAVIGLGLVAFLALAALGSLDAGGHSFEF
jgi:peptidoglycan/LPS O-acetylase OafA/YrhL